MAHVSEQLEPGDHAAFFYESRLEQMACVIPFIKAGLLRNERCLYVADDNSVPVILNRLEQAGVDVNQALFTDALHVTTKQHSYLRSGVFDPDEMIAQLREQVVWSLTHGFSGFRATGETTWALDLPSALVRLLEYETKLNADFPSQFIGLCQYDETRFPAQLITEMIQVHPIVIRRGRLIRNQAAQPPASSFSNQTALCT